MKLTIVIPVFNEEKTIAEVLDRVNDLDLKKIDKEIIVVDDGSTDKTKDKIKAKIEKVKGLKFIIQEKNGGKGSAVASGIKNSTGDYIIIQDADLEYDPKDIPKLLSPIISKKTQVVYGTRLNRFPNFKRDERTLQFLIHYFGNRLLSLLTSLLYGKWITDMETCYKIFPKKALNGIVLKSRRFDFEPEITAKLLKKGYSILEIPISTNPRSYEEGKKLNTVKDGTMALYTLFKYRFVD